MTSKDKKNGAASIPFVLGIGVLTLLIAISITSVELVRVYLEQANIHGLEAREYAEAGLRDALMKISRDATFKSPEPNYYQIDMNSGGCSTFIACARVSVSSSTATTTDPKVIKSIGYYKASRIGLSAQVIFDAKSRGGITVIGVSQF